MKNVFVQPSFTDRETKSLNIYLNELNKIPVLTKEQEVELFKQYKEGSLVQREKLITHNLRFVISIAKHYQNMGILFEDLVEEGNIGLIRQLQKYDPSTDIKFITYQVWWIKQQMMYQLSLYSRQIRLPQNRILELDKIYRFINTYEQEKSYPPSIEDIAEYMDIDKKQILNFMDLDRPIVYLFDQITEDFTVIDSIAQQ